MRQMTRRGFLARGGAAVAGSLVPLTFGVAAEAGMTTGARPSTTGWRPVWTLGGELEYYRSDPAHWEQRLEVCAGVGYNTIQTYVPWNVHESQPGRLDFAGATSPVLVDDHVDQYTIETPPDQIANGGLTGRVVANTNLEGFLGACARHQMQVILRPGPFISDEWRNGGLPDWLLNAGFPRMYMRGPSGSPLQPGFPFSPPVANQLGGGPEFYFVGPSYASEEFLASADRWLAGFAAFARPWLATNGGPVVAVQVDDEICYYYRFGPFEVDYHPAVLARYHAQTGEDAPRGWPAPGGPPAALAPAFRWQRFKAQQLGGYLRHLAAELRAGGIDVPITHEHELQLSPPAGYSELAGAVDALNPEFYNGDPGPWSLPLNELCAQAVRAAQDPGRQVVAAELDPSSELLRYLLIGEGLDGALGFTYTEGAPDAAVSALQRVGRTIRTAGDRLAAPSRRVDTAIVWCPQQFWAPYGSANFGFDRDVRNVAERDMPALASLLVRSGMAFDLLDTDVAATSDYNRYPAIWLAASDLLPRSTQSNLVAYVKSGGRLVCWPSPPTLDEELQPCTVLADALYTERPAEFYPEDYQEIDVLGLSVPVWRGVQTYSLSPRAAAIAQRGSQPCGYLRQVGDGEAVLLGTWPVADLLAGAAGLVLELQQLPSGPDAETLVAGRAAELFRSAGTAAATTAGPGPEPAGPAQYLVVYQYSNERRGGEFITGGSVGYWDGLNVVPVGEVSTAENAPPASKPPFRPILPAHQHMAGRLHGRRPVVSVSDTRAQVRALDGGADHATTLSVVNRWPTAIDIAISLPAEGRDLRLPQQGTLTLPASTAMLLPVGYQLAPSLTLVQATVQLLDYTLTPNSLSLAMYSPAGGEVVLELPGPLASAQPAPAEGPFPAPPATTADARQVRLQLAPGERHLTVTWRTP